MTGDEARDFVERLAEWTGETSGRMMEELIQDAKDLVNPPRRPRSVYLSQDNIVVALDAKGRPIPELQGPFDKVRDKILQLADDKTEFNGWTP